MGHIRLGRLPKTRRWVQVIDLLDASPEDTPGLDFDEDVGGENGTSIITSEQPEA